MCRIVDRAVVEQDQVLVGRSSPYIESAGGFAYRFYARQHHDDPYHVFFTEYSRHILYILEIDSLYS